MCIILYKPKGVKLPEKDILKNCWNNNYDGAGLMYRTSTKVTGQKGFMKLKHLGKALKGLDTLGLDLVVHFRFATHGLQDDTATHPFPISTDTKKLTTTMWTAGAGIAHNGIISTYGTKLLSDTQDFIHKDLGYFYDLADRPEIHKYLASKGGKYALMTCKKTYLIGDFVSQDGCFFSNTDYKAWSLPVFSPKTYYTSWRPTALISEKTEKLGADVDFCRITGRLPDYKHCSKCDYWDQDTGDCILDGVQLNQ